MHPLSPPHSPSAAPSGSRHHEHHPQEQVFAGDCLSDTFDAIDRAEMNKYLLPDQNGMLTYAHPASVALTQSPNPAGGVSHYSTLTSMPGNANNSSSTMGTNLPAGPSSSPGNLPSLQSMSHSRLLSSTSAGFNNSPSSYYNVLGSPQEIVETSSPEITPVEVIGASGSPVPSGESPEPHPEYVELQPSKPMSKDESLASSIGSGLKPSSVNHFLSQNLCYPQHYPYNYSYTYPMWHG